MGFADNYPRVPLLIGIAFLALVVLVELLFVLALNDGKLVYTLDDPYIHLALAENLGHGHYGVNVGENSAPSSSILWPYLLVPLSSRAWFPFLVNCLAAVLTVLVCVRVMDQSLEVEDRRARQAVVSLMVMLFVLATNMVGLIFTGMEHSLQQLLAAAVACGLIVEARSGKVPVWLLVAIVLGPLVRYENLAISIAGLGYLSLSGHRGQALAGLLALVVLIGGFSAYLVTLGLGPYPASIVAKSTVVESGGGLRSFLSNLDDSLSCTQGLVLSLGALGLLGYAVRANLPGKKRLLAAVAVPAVVMHLAAGSYGWYNRYEIYMWTYLLLIAFSLAGKSIGRLLVSDSRISGLVKIAVLATVFVAMTGPRYVKGLMTLPTGANNIYEQQYQMHRFVVDYYGKPVAVNDIGYVSYQNDQYVLDLWGLASKEAHQLRRSSQDQEWMNALIARNEVELVMIYDDVFGGLPERWIKIGDLVLGGRRVTVAGSRVTFFAMNQDASAEIVDVLNRFVPTLPHGVEFIFDHTDALHSP